MISKKFALGLGVLALAAASGVAQAQQQGPAPTLTSIQNVGPFAISSQVVRGTGFGGGTVYSPNTPGKYAYVALCPGFTARQTSVRTLGMRLASHGFVVAIIDTNSTTDFPESRGTQLAAALRAMRAITTGPAAGKIDNRAGRFGVGGHSMGGGGATIALRNDRTIRAGMAFAPFVQSTVFTAVNAQAYGVIVGTNDTVAPAARHTTPIVNSIIVDNPTLACIQTGATHSTFTGTAAVNPANLYQIAVFKRFLDNDTRYQQFLVRQPACGTFRSAGLQ
jgi:alpha-beta hydrolase superfamily lysophospholipase